MTIQLYMNMFLYLLMILSAIMAISSTNMFMIWLSMELNLFSFIPLMMTSTKPNESEAAMNYFLIQALGSTLFLLSSSMLLSTHWFTNFNYMLLVITMLMKMGMAPCHYWYPTTMELISWMNCFILSTWQKMAPLFIMLFIIMPKMNYKFSMIIASMNAIIGGVMGLSQTSLKKIMAYSSITHMGWILSGSVTNFPCMSITYLIIYSLMVFPLFNLFSKFNMIKIHDLWYKQKLPMMQTIMLMLMLLSLSGMPPMTGFMPKLMMMNKLMNNSTMLTVTLIIGSLLNLFFYLNIMLNSLINSKNLYKKNNKVMSLKPMNFMLTMNILTIYMLML